LQAATAFSRHRMPIYEFICENALKGFKFALSKQWQGIIALVGGAQLRVSAHLKGSTLLVEVAGEFDMTLTEEFRTTVDSYLDTGMAKFLLIDLSKVTFIDSSGLGAILGRYKKIQGLKGKIVLVGPHSQVKRILNVSGINTIIGIYEDKKSALNHLG
jgi:stage II sporulation protein AA (anti-sigma F factor antagonist)